MSTSKNTLLALAALLLIITACEKDRIEESTDDKSSNQVEYSESSTDTYFESKQEEQEFEVTNEDSNEPIVGKDGTEIYISKNCLKFPNGDTVGFPYTVKLVEIYSPRDAVFWEMPTVSNGNVLASDGQVRVRAEKDGQELELNGNCPVVINTVSQNVDYSMRGWETTGSLPISWSLLDTSNLNKFYPRSGGFQFVMYDRFNWLNVDKLEDSLAYTISYSSDSVDVDKVKKFVYIKDLNSLMNVYSNISFPLPENYDLVTFGIALDADANLYMFEESLKMTENKQVEVIMKPTTDADLEIYLNNLK